MKNKKTNISLLNVISSVLLQIVTIISGFIIPRIILTVFGSEVNGLVSSLNQFLNYISLFEGGLGGVVLASLYKPLYDKNNKKINSIVNTTKKFYKKISIVFIIYTLLIAVIYPLIVKTSFSYEYVFSLTIILSLTTFIQYNFSLSLKLLLQADKKVYIVSFTQVVLTIINIVSFYVFSKVFPNIHTLKLISALIFLLQPFIYNKYVNKYYNINKNIIEETDFTKSRWDGLAINIAAFIHNNTDIAILTLFTNLKMVSVYSIYFLVITGLKKVITSISAGITPSLGHLYAKGNIKELNNKFELYEFIIFFITYFIFTIGGLLITNFVLIYTNNITDINYNQPIFGVLLIISEMIFCLRDPYVSMAYSANKFKEIKTTAYIEAILNIIISIALVSKFGLIGVAIGTIISMAYRTIFQVIYLKKNILKRNVSKFIKKFCLFTLISIIGIIICKTLLPIEENTVFNFIKYSFIYSIIIFLLYFINSLIFYRDDLKQVSKIIFKK